MRGIGLALAMGCAPLVLSGCVETPTLSNPGMSNPAMGYSAAEISQLTGLPAAMMRNDAQCAQSNATLADPSSTENERFGATTAARANGCPGF